jgi:hypothetical protein
VSTDGATGERGWFPGRELQADAAKRLEFLGALGAHVEVRIERRARRRFEVVV